jgi:hypothetical protein
MVDTVEKLKFIAAITILEAAGGLQEESARVRQKG